MRPDQVAALGIAHVPEGRGTLGNLTVRENLRVGAYRRKDRKRDPARHRLPASTCSRNLRSRITSNGVGPLRRRAADARGAPGRSWRSPGCSLLDEASLGLAPSTAKNVYDAIRRLRAESGIAMLVVEQNANLAFTLVDAATCSRPAATCSRGSTAELKGMDEIRRAYLGG